MDVDLKNRTYNMDDMASKQNGRKKGRKRMKYNPLRLGIVVGIALCMVILVFAGGFSLFRSLSLIHI